MSNLSNKFIRRVFRRIDGVVWDLLTGKVGVKTPDGVFTLETSGEGDTLAHGISVNPIDVGSFALPGFAMLTQLDEVNAGDIVVGDHKILGFAESTTGAKVNVIDLQGQHKSFTPPKVAIGGQSGVLVVKNLFNLTGGADGASAFAGNMLPLLALLGDKTGDDGLTTMLMVQALSGAQGGAAAGGNAGGMNAMLSLLLLKDGGLGGSAGGIDAKTLMLMQAMGGGNAGGLNSILPLLLLKDGGLGGSGGNAGLKDLLLMQSLAGGGANIAANPMLMAMMLGESESAAPVQLSVPTTPVVPPLVPSLRQC